MKAAVREVYGSSEVVSVQEVPTPEPGADEVLLRLQAVSLNSSDWEFLTGSPAYIRMWGLFRPRVKVLGSDVVGQVVKVGKDVTKFRSGDSVFGDILGSFGGLAEYATAPAKLLSTRPDTLDIHHAAALPQAGLVALQGLRKGCRLQAGEHVLINGAGGGSGSYAVQLAKLWGARVTAVDRGDKLEFLKQLGADETIDYEKEDFADGSRTYDAVLDLVARRPLLQVRRALAKGGRYALCGGTVGTLLSSAFLGPLVSAFSDKKLGIVVVTPSQDDVAELVSLIDTGKIRPMIDRTYPLAEARAALSYLGQANCRGKVVVTL